VAKLLLEATTGVSMNFQSRATTPKIRQYAKMAITQPILAYVASRES
jgi:hypothetical protein